MQRAGNGRCRKRERIDTHTQLAQFLLCGHSKLLLLVDNQQAQIFEFHILAQDFVGAHEYIYTARFEVGQNLFSILGRTCAAQVVHPYGQSSHTLRKGAVVLQCEDCCGHQHGHLLAVAGRLEGRPYGHLGLAEAHIATHKPIHRLTRLHIGLNELYGLLLIGRLLIHKRALQLVLQIVVGRETETTTRLALGIEAYQLASNILDGLFGGLFHPLPSARAEFVDLWWSVALFALVASNAVQGVNAHQQHIAIAIDQLDRLLLFAPLDGVDKASETPHSVVDMHHIITYLQLIKLGNGHTLPAVYFSSERVAVIALENLVVGVEAHP